MNEDDMIKKDNCEYLNVLSEDLYRNKIGGKPGKFQI